LLYKKAINKNAEEKNLVVVGKWTVVVAMFLAVLLALVIGEQLMGEGKQGFQYIQEYTGFFSPGIFAMFILGFFWKKTTSDAALFATIGGLVFSIILKFLPQFANLSFLAPYGFSKATAAGVYEIPFLDRMSFVFTACIIGMVIISIIQNQKSAQEKAFVIDKSMFRLSNGFIAGALLATGIIAALYALFW
jgi:SSS family solute:Na+ symporter